MPQFDIYHQTVKNALIKDGWAVTHDPFVLHYKKVFLYADLAGEKIFSAKREEKNIVVEVKTFSNLSRMSDLEKAVGQYIIYRFFLERNFSDRILYLAITEEIYKDFFEKPAIQDLIIFLNINLVVFDPKKEEIILWTK